MSEYEYKKFELATAVILVSIVSLVVTAVLYWLIMKQDSTILTTVSASLGGIIGYYFKILTEKKVEENG